MTSRTLNRIAFAVICVPAIWQIGLLAYTIARRVAYPFDLEWMEGGLLDHAARLQEGSGLYTPPSVEFISYLYTPLYPALLAILGEVFGLGYTLGRVLSVLSLIVCAIVVVCATQAPRQSWSIRGAFSGVLALGLICAAYPWLEGWYDLVRGDTVFVAMVLVGLLLLARYSLEPASGRKAHIRIGFVAALLALSFFCKQIGILFVLAGGLNLLLWWRWRLLITYVIVSGVIGLGGTGLLQLSTDGWFWTYIYEVHQSHDFNYDRFYLSFSHMLKRSITATLSIGVALLCVIACLAARRKLPAEAKRYLFWLGPWVIALFTGAVGWGTQWAHFNAYMSAIFVGAVCVAAAFVCIRAIAEMWFPRAGCWIALALPIALALELFSQRWSPKPFVPTARDAAAGQRLVEMIRGIDGEVMVPYHPWYARLAGKETWVHRMGLMDVRLDRKHKVRGLPEAFDQRRFSAIILDNRPIRFELSDLRRGYRKHKVIPHSHRPRVFTGGKVVPETIWIPIGPPTPPPPGARILFDFDFEENYAGWQTSGTAWGKTPRRYTQDRGKAAALEFTGTRYAHSTVGGARAVGELVSPTFVIDGSRITARIGGGKASSDGALVVELRVDGKSVRTASPSGGTKLSRVEWKVDALRGKRATIALIDRDTGPRGTLYADAFWIWDR